MSGTTQPGRDDLARWKDGQPANFFDASPRLARSLAVWGGEELASTLRPELSEFGAAAATVIEPSVVTLELRRELPAYAGFDPIGRKVESIEFHPAYETAGRAAWGSGMLAGKEDTAGHFRLAALFYLLSHTGEGGHACPIVCTAGMIRALRRRGPAELAERYLPGLTATEYDRCLRGSQFLTEVQGGSDVGANVVAVVPDPALDGAYRLTGEKWFCSVADADLFAVTARPEGAVAGTKGLGCFLVPRLVDGEPNGFRIRRLKNKLGTRALASAEIDFDGALCFPVGPLDAGFQVAVEDLLNTSRWLNAVGSTGLMRRAYLEASSFARHRHAFGTPIASFPLVREQLAVMKADEHAALSSTLALTQLLGLLDEGEATERQQRAYRFLVNANKYVTSTRASEVVRRGIEVLGGNGTIEDFSALPRLYRDSMVYESWEGTHNVLCAQVLRDGVRLGVVEEAVAWLRDLLEQSGATELAGGAAIAERLGELEPVLASDLADPARGAAHFRRHLDRLLAAVQAGLLLVESVAVPSDTESAAVAELFRRRHLDRADPADDPEYGRLVDAVLGADLG